jgi:hypothetical protein
VVGLNSGAEIEDKIYTKFAINDPENWQLFINENGTRNVIFYASYSH